VEYFLSRSPLGESVVHAANWLNAHGNRTPRLVQMLGVFAEFERATMVDRVIAGNIRSGGP
jgi:hypothetical protein